MKALHFIFVSGFAAAALCAAGCSELKDTLPNESAGALSVHPSGWTTTSSSNFHGRAIRDQNWDMKLCQTCHGKDYAGGFVEVSCRTCHSKPAGPENCTTCHGGTNAAPPRDLSGATSPSVRTVGAHQVHVLGGTLSGPTPCTECHKVPGGVYDPGHVDTPSPAEVQFLDVLANTKTTGVLPAPNYNASNAACSGTYCHGTFRNGNPNFAPVWNDPSGAQRACGTCHGDVSKPTLAERALPKTSAQGGNHPNVLNCAACHADVVDASLRIIDRGKHINGKLNVFGQERDY